MELDAPPGGEISAAAGVVWASVGRELVRIDGTRTPPTPTKVVGVVPNRIEAFPGGAWVAARNTNELAKIC